MLRTALGVALTILVCVAPVAGQSQEGTPPASPPQDQPAVPSDRAVDPSQPDFTLIGLPTTLRLPKYGMAFRVTHRFTRSLGQGDFGDLLGDAFGVDGSAQIGLEFRFGLLPGTQIGIHRTSDRTIEFFGQHQLLRQSDRVPLGLDVYATAEGTNNFRDRYSPALGAVISRTIGRHGAIYAHPMWINNTNPLPSELTDDDNDTFIVGIAGRLRIRPNVYVVVESVPRFGFTPDANYLSFALEKRWGGHMFQINFSNGFGTTLTQIARGGFNYDDWFLGFNISRKFFGSR